MSAAKKYRARQDIFCLALSGTFRPFPRVGQRVSLDEPAKIKPLKKLQITKENHRNRLIPVNFFYNLQLFWTLNFWRFFKTHTLTHTGKGAESTGQGQTGNFLSGPVFFAAFTASAG